MGDKERISFHYDSMTFVLLPTPKLSVAFFMRLLDSIWRRSKRKSLTPSSVPYFSFLPLLSKGENKKAKHINCGQSEAENHN